MASEVAAARTVNLGAPNGRQPVEETRRERRRPDPVVYLVCATGAVTFAASLWLALSLIMPEGVASGLSPMSMAHDARANRLVEMRPVSAGALRQARRETWAALNQSPVDDAAWLRLAYIDRLEHPALTAAGRTGLERSYDVAPFGPEVSAWRVRFALENWPALTPDLRRQVLKEIELQWPAHRGRYAGMAGQVSEPAGRLAIDLELSGLRRRDALRAPAQPKRDSSQ